MLRHICYLSLFQLTYYIDGLPEDEKNNYKLENNWTQYNDIRCRRMAEVCLLINTYLYVQNLSGIENWYWLEASREWKNHMFNPIGFNMHRFI